MAIAEVVKHPEAPQTPNPYYVVRNSGTYRFSLFFFLELSPNDSLLFSVDFVTTRFFLFYPGGMNNVQSVMANSLDLSKYV